MKTLVFLKLGGSLLTEKTAVEALRPDVLAHISAQIRQARQENPSLFLVIGHGSGSFGHVAAAEHHTRQGVRTAAEWAGFARVSDAAARLNRIVVAALLAEQIPAVSLAPSASAVCADGRIEQIATGPLKAALMAGLVPVVYGDVAFDLRRGGTIISTEEVFAALASDLKPSWMLLAGDTDGVYDQTGARIPLITPRNLAAVAPALSGSRGTDVTGGMAAKVDAMLELVQTIPDLQIRIFSGLMPDHLSSLLAEPARDLGTCLRAE